MAKGSPFKTIASMMAGFALAAVGIDTVTGQLRLTFDFAELLKGFDFLIAVIGLFGIGEILLTIEEGLEFKGTKAKLECARSCSRPGRSCRGTGRRPSAPPWWAA